MPSLRTPSRNHGGVSVVQRCMKRPYLALLVLVGALALSACQHTVAMTQRPLTTCGNCGDRNAANVLGTFRMVGGPAPGISRPLSGTIAIHKNNRNGRIVKTVHAAGRGMFATFLPTGRYWLVGTSPQFDGSRRGCPTVHPVSVATSQPVVVRVVCEAK